MSNALESDKKKEHRKKNREVSFVDFVFTQRAKDKGFAARMRRGDNPATEYESWNVLAAFGVNLENDRQRQAYALIGSAIVRSKALSNGSIKLGEALAKSFDQQSSDQADRRLRRLLACSSTSELCQILRPLLSLIRSKKMSDTLDYSELLQDIVWFEVSPQKKKVRWAQQFYRHTTEASQ